MKMKVKLAILILIIGLSTVWASEKSPTAQMVVFVNTMPKVTVLGLVKFVVDEKNNPVDYVILNNRWYEEKKVLWLEPGLYGITQYCPKFSRVIDYRYFWVKDKPILIEM